MTDHFPDTSVDEHVAYGHHATGPADVFSDQIVSRIVRMVCQQESSAAACRASHPLSGMSPQKRIHRAEQTENTRGRGYWLLYIGRSGAA